MAKLRSEPPHTSKVAQDDRSEWGNNTWMHRCIDQKWTHTHRHTHTPFWVQKEKPDINTHFTVCVFTFYSFMWRNPRKKTSLAIFNSWPLYFWPGGSDCPCVKWSLSSDRMSCCFSKHPASMRVEDLSSVLLVSLPTIELNMLLAVTELEVVKHTIELWVLVVGPYWIAKLCVASLEMLKDLHKRLFYFYSE